MKALKTEINQRYLSQHNNGALCDVAVSFAYNLFISPLAGKSVSGEILLLRMRCENMLTASIL